MISDHNNRLSFLFHPVTDPSDLEFRISIDDPELKLGQGNNISLVINGSQGTQATINLPVRIRGKTTILKDWSI